jgi:starch phosphorylase
MIGPEQARIRSFKVVPSLPQPLEPLLDIAHNLWWTWHPEAVELFVRLDRELWREVGYNPVRMLGRCSQERLDEAARDEGFLNSLLRVAQKLKADLRITPWLQKSQEDLGHFTIAYFCAEFGMAECLPIYSGGLGCLAGDHLKSASELGLPLVGVGLMYRHGYFQQYLNAEGWQQEYYADLDLANLPLTQVTDAQDKPVSIMIDMPGRQLHVGVWKVHVGRIDLYLMDTNLPENERDDRMITGQLYGGDMEMRIKQEIVLGIGGMRALRTMGIEPDVCHMNEGHSAFLALERIRTLVAKHDISFDEAREFAAAGNVFTTHTPVSAGIDRFPPEMIQRYFKGYHETLRLDLEGLLALGRENVFAKNEFFSMAVLAVRTASWCNGVSKLHGSISRNMWRSIWPGLPEDEIPITHVTNGVHARTWLSAELIATFDRYLGSRWQQDPTDQTVWGLVNEVPNEELWRVRERCRQHLTVWARRRLRQQLEARGTDAALARKHAEALRPDALTIGFARRFATYKRANLLLRDPQRLTAMLESTDRPIQFIIAGKAHPADRGGKDLIKQIVHFARDSDAGHRIVFIENYDMHVARFMVQGCDVWLNTPRRGMEASGTSGMKAAINGVLNCSVLDGWWDEAYESDLGWAIGRGETYADLESQDQIESHALYDLLEKQIIPQFYDRDEHDIPQTWVAKIKRCISILAPQFNTNRMVQQYAEKLYLPSLVRARMLGDQSLGRSVALSHLKRHMRHQWSKLAIEEVQANTGSPMGVRDSLSVDVIAFLGELQPQELAVQAYYGLLDNEGRIPDGKTLDLAYDQDLGQGRHRFTGSVPTSTSGRHGFAIRIVPGGRMFERVAEPGLIYWEHEPPAAPPSPVASAKPEPEPAAAHA